MIRAVLGKELITTWASPVPYVVGAAFHVVLGVVMVDQLQGRGQAVVQPLFPLAGFLVLLVVPVLTMRTFAEETRTGTLDLLLAIPVPNRVLVVGKWVASWLTALVVLAPATAFAGLLALWGDPDPGPAMSGFLGLVLLAGAVAGVGTLCSAATSSQPVAAMTAIFASVGLWFVHVGGEAVASDSLARAVSFSERLRLFAGGAVDTGDVAFFVAVIVAALVACNLVLDLRRLR